MGLDQQAIAFTKEEVDAIGIEVPPINFLAAMFDALESKEELARFRNEDGSVIPSCVGGRIARWRKHANLQGWMTRLYHTRGGSGDLNLTNDVAVEEMDLDDLEREINLGLIPEATGFFWGESKKEDDVSTLEFIKLARKIIKDGGVVRYSAWF